VSEEDKRIRDELATIEEVVEFNVEGVDPAKAAFWAIDRIREKHLPSILKRVEELERRNAQVESAWQSDIEEMERMRQEYEALKQAADQLANSPIIDMMRIVGEAAYRKDSG
jgi:hypothetical protein